MWGGGRKRETVRASKPRLTDGGRRDAEKKQGSVEVSAPWLLPPLNPGDHTEIGRISAKEI